MDGQNNGCIWTSDSGHKVIPQTEFANNFKNNKIINPVPESLLILYGPLLFKAMNFAANYHENYTPTGFELN